MASFTLHIQYVDRPAETRTFTQPRLTIGRESGDIILRDNQVSGEHAEIPFTETGLQYVDVGSTNGSFTPDGRRIAKLNLSKGSSVRAGNSMLTVRDVQLDRPARKGGTLIAAPGSIPGMLAGRPGSIPGVPGAPSMPGATPSIPGAAPALANTPTPAGGEADPYAATSFIPQVDPNSLDAAATPGQPEQPATEASQPGQEAATPSAGEQLQQGVSQIGQELASAAAAQGITGDDLKASLKDAWALVAPVLVPASLMVAAIEIPATLAALVLGWIPAVGSILALLINLVAGIALIL
ncbi:MAG: FHA domain-containing protein, partial [Nannocystaceae bacterium]